MAAGSLLSTGGGWTGIAAVRAQGYFMGRLSVTVPGSTFSSEEYLAAYKRLPATDQAQLDQTCLAKIREIDALTGGALRSEIEGASAAAGQAPIGPFAAASISGQGMSAVDLGSVKSAGGLVTYDWLLLLRDRPKDSSFDVLETQEARCADGLLHRKSMTIPYDDGRRAPAVPIEDDEWIQPVDWTLEIVCSGTTSPAGTFADLSAAREAIARLPLDAPPTPPPVPSKRKASPAP